MPHAQSTAPVHLGTSTLEGNVLQVARVARSSGRCLLLARLLDAAQRLGAVLALLDLLARLLHRLRQAVLQGVVRQGSGQARGLAWAGGRGGQGLEGRHATCTSCAKCTTKGSGFKPLLQLSVAAQEAGHAALRLAPCCAATCIHAAGQLQPAASYGTAACAAGSRPAPQAAQSVA